MSASDDPSSDMASRSPSESARRLLRGPEPTDAEWCGPEVQRLLDALRTPTVSTGAREREAVASIAAAVRAAAPASLTERRTRARRLPVVAAAAAAVLLVGGTAAATGSLPDAAQSTVSRALAQVHVDVPNPDHADPDRPDTPAGGESAHGGDAIGPDATGAAKHGLCTAWAARTSGDADRGRSGDSKAFANLRHAAHDAGMLVRDFCAEELAEGPAHATDPGGTAADAPGRPQDVPDGTPGGDHGAPVTTPSDGGIGTGSTASGGGDATGVEHAAPAASDGSANAGDHGPPAAPPAAPPDTSHRP